MHEHAWIWLLPAAPLLGSLVCGILHFGALSARKSRPDARGPGSWSATVAVLAMAAAFGLSLLAFQELRELPADGRVLRSPAWSWISTGVFPIDVALVIDPLSSVMTLVITGVGLLIHIYAGGYMKGDPGYAKFFAYLNLFVFAMLLLVLSSSLPGLFIGWEGVGLCSYLLIGFWYEKGWPAEAGQKAFVMNRIGDACFLLGTFLLARALGTLDIGAIVQAAPGAATSGLATDLALAGLLLFAGACGKSAQIPLFTWLPDAMAGPTPVSALIHAATMVTAGVYLVARLNPIYAASPALMLLVASIGAATAFVAGSSALLQRDIKKVLAYSTVSQLGFMFLGLGTGAFAAAIFHLVTHAFFKALLFLGAGSVIHGMHHEQDMHKMGGLARRMPHTFATFLAGAAALSGLPLMSGFFSKDEILASAVASGGAYWALWVVGLLAAALTAFYTWRMVALTFFGRERFDAEHVHPHESPFSMTLPLWILAVLAVLGGALGLPVVTHLPHLLGEWLAPVLEPGASILAARHASGGHLSHAMEWSLLGLGAAIALAFAHKGFHACENGPGWDENVARAKPELAGFLTDAWGLDRFYQRAIVQPLVLLAFGIAVVVDQFAIDGLVDGAGSLARSLGGRARSMATGQIAAYGLWMGAAVALIAIFLLLGGS
ncbi:MAG: NADH-quinone oxidoreductase subunit L [Planctomycetota bacterium]